MFSKAHRVANSNAKRVSVYDKLVAEKAKAAATSLGPAKFAYIDDNDDFDAQRATYLDAVAEGRV